MFAGRIRKAALVAGASFAVAGVALAQQATERAQERAQGIQDRAQAEAQSAERGVQTQIDRAQGQSATGERRTAGFRAGGQAGESQQVDKFLAKCLLIKNQAEIEMNQFGQQQSDNPQVKQFAQQMVQDHQQLVQQLQQVAGHQGAESSRQSVGTTGQSDTQRSATNTQQTPALNSQSAGAGGDSGALQEIASIEKQIADRCGQMLKQKLQEKQGAEFDKAFVGSQVAAHINMLATLEVVGQQASGELGQIAQQAEQKVQQHLQHAEQLMQQLDRGQQSRTGAQSPTSEARTTQ